MGEGETGMKKQTYLAEWNSEGNFLRCKKVVRGFTLAEAQTEFFDWLKTHPVYEHMRKMDVEFIEVDE
jgi:hypothetical protein